MTNMSEKLCSIDPGHTHVPSDHGYALGLYEVEIERHSSTSEDEGDLDGLPVFSPPHVMDIPSVRRCQ